MEWTEIRNKCESLFNSAYIIGANPCIPVSYSMSESLDIFNLVLIVLMPCLTGFLFDLYPKFSGWLPLFPSLTAAFSVLQLFIVHLFTIVYE